MINNISKNFLLGLSIFTFTCAPTTTDTSSPPAKPREVVFPFDGGRGLQVDMLWVIDNSGSMCQEQETVAKNFKLFLDEVDELQLDFHLAITTTHMTTDYPTEPVAKPGHIQSTPQPIPGFDRACINSVDAEGKPIDGEFDPLKKSIAAAVKCMTTPDESFNVLTTADIICAVDEIPDCEIEGKCGGQAGTKCSIADLFPTENDYRSIPKVLKAGDYKIGNRLDVIRLVDDFACMSLVGTRGHGIEKGLAAALAATRIDLTGGPVDDDQGDNYNASASNHGFLRKHSRFALVFLTDENDCSHDGTLDENNSCGDATCAYANIEGEEENSPLLRIQNVRDQLFENLKLSKNRQDFGEGEILVASIHGEPKRFAGEKLTECSMSETGVAPVCSTALGDAFSGDRYQRFLQSFGEGQYFPSAYDATQGWLCAEDFSPALTAIGEFVGNLGGNCISRSIYPCQESSECPAYPYSDRAGECVEIPNSDGQKYCNSALEVRGKLNSPTPENLERLIANEYCVEGSVDTATFPKGCVISPEKYALNVCPAGLAGIQPEWINEAEAKSVLTGMTFDIRALVLDNSY